MNGAARRLGTMNDTFDVLVIGGGTAGLVTASGCARLGRRVALVEREALGGDCLWTGCVPTKALVATARLAQRMRNAAAFGLGPAAEPVDPKAIMESMHAAQRITAKHDDPQRFSDLGIEVIEGAARFVSRDSVAVNGRLLRAKDVVIATGSRTAVPPVAGLQECGFLDHVSFLRQDSIPDSVLILGGGAIGIEFAQIFRRFGAKVTVVEMFDDILVREDAAVIARVRQILEEEGVEIHAGWTAKSARAEGGGKVLRIEAKNGETRTLRAAEIFVAAGRRGNIEELGLDAAAVRTERSYVAVNKYLQTSSPRIWACGDVHGGLQFTHVAAYEALKLVRNLLFPGRSAVDYEHVPWAIYVDPEVAHIGMTEAEAHAAGNDVRVYQTEMLDVDRAVVERATGGLVKFVCDAKGRILGAHAVCPDASSLVETIVLARKQGVRIGEIARLVWPYPSFGDALSTAASGYYRDLGTGRLGALARRVAAWSQ